MKRAKKRTRIGGALLLTVVVAGSMFAAHTTPAAAAATVGPVPTQWIMQQYTELLGRTPTAAEWSQAVTKFDENVACDASSLAQMGGALARL